MTDPLALFNTHCIAQVKVGAGTELFDPSYGKRFTGATAAKRLLAWQNGSLDFVGGMQLIPRNAEDLALSLLPVTAKTVRRYIIH
jgi:hypothetical protein